MLKLARELEDRRPLRTVSAKPVGSAEHRRQSPGSFQPGFTAARMAPELPSCSHRRGSLRSSRISPRDGLDSEGWSTDKPRRRRLRIETWGLRGDMAELETGRLLIREMRASDADDFLRYRQQEDYWRHAPIEPPTLDSIAASVNGWIQNQDQNPRTAYNLAVIDKRSDQLVGDAGLFVRSIRSRQGEIGWGVVSNRAGQGLATEIGEALLRLAFDTLSLHRVFAQCRLGNLASRRIMTKLGMREEGVLRENVLARGEWWSSAQSSILSTEWRSVTKRE
jgi:[ribosomal protein S5]-alanine N-acetyltransferase